MKLLLVVHLLAVVVWVGGMFFAHQVLRPVAADRLEPPLRLGVWVGVFSRFFPWVWACVAAILVTGLLMIARMGGMSAQPAYIHAMLGLGFVMAVVFVYIYFVPFVRLKACVGQQDWKGAAAALGRIRHLVGANLAMGLLTVAIAGTRGLTGIL